jgi:hypothetical protein
VFCKTKILKEMCCNTVIKGESRSCNDGGQSKTGNVIRRHVEDAKEGNEKQYQNSSTYI